MLTFESAIDELTLNTELADKLDCVIGSSRTIAFRLRRATKIPPIASSSARPAPIFANKSVSDSKSGSGSGGDVTTSFGLLGAFAASEVAEVSANFGAAFSVSLVAAAVGAGDTPPVGAAGNRPGPLPGLCLVGVQVDALMAAGDGFFPLQSSTDLLG